MNFVVFKSKRQKAISPAPLSINGINQVQSIKILGITLCNDLSVTTHIGNTLTSCAQSLFALKTLRAHGMQSQALCDVYNATTLAKLSYASSAWWGFTSATDRLRLESFLRKSRKFNFYSESGPTFEVIAARADDKLFHKVLTNPNHTLAYLLPPPTTHNYHLRIRPHNRFLPSINTDPQHRNFFSRMLFKDIY